MGLKSAIQETLEDLAKMLPNSNEDLIFEESTLQRRHDLDRIRTQIEDAQHHILELNESIRTLEKARKEKTEEKNAKGSQLVTSTSKLEALKEENRNLSGRIKQFRQRKVQARSEFSTKDVAALEDTKLKLRLCRVLTGVHFNTTQKAVSGGYVANSATERVKLFDVGDLPRKEATRKIWEAIKNTTAHPQ